MKRSICLLVVSCAWFAACNPALRSAGPSAGAEDVAAAVGRRDYTIDIYDIQPAYRSEFGSSSGYFLSVAGDSLTCRLPYLGRAYTPVARDEELGRGLMFDGTIHDYAVKTGRSGLIGVGFGVVTMVDRYRFELEIYPDGNSTVNVYPAQKNMITFYGKTIKTP